MSNPSDFIDEFQRRYESSQEFEDRFHAAEIEANDLFAKATQPQHAAYRNAIAISVVLHGHGSMAHEATIRLAHGQFTRDTVQANDLAEQTLREILDFDEISDETSEAWSALIKPRLGVVSPEPSNQEAA